MQLSSVERERKPTRSRDGCYQTSTKVALLSGAVSLPFWAIQLRQKGWFLLCTPPVIPSLHLMFQKAASILPNKRDCLKEIIHLPCNLDGRELAARSGFVMGQPLLLWAETQAGRSGMNFHRVLIGWKASPALPPLCGLLTSWVLTTACLHLLWLIRSCFFFSEGARKEGQKPKPPHAELHPMAVGGFVTLLLLGSKAVCWASLSHSLILDFPQLLVLQTLKRDSRW